MDTFFSGDKIIAIISLVISFIALWHTYSVNKSFARNQLIIDQVKVVSDLVNYLNRKKIGVNFRSISDDTSSSGRAGELTLFELLDPSSHFSTFDDAPVLLDSNRCNEIFELIKYLNDPLIPISIATELAKFMNGGNFIVKPYSEFSGSSIVIINSGVRYDYNLLQYRDDELRNNLIVGNAIALKSWLSFKTCAESLKNEINKWLKSKEIDDLNIRTEFQPY